MQKKAIALAVAAMISSGAFAQVRSGGSAVLVDDGAGGYVSAGPNLDVTGALTASTVTAGSVTAGAVSAGAVTATVVNASGGVVLADAVVIDGALAGKTVIQDGGLVTVEGVGGSSDTTTISGGAITAVDITSTGLTNGLQANKLTATNGNITNLTSASLSAGTVQTTDMAASSAIIGGGSAVPGNELTVNGDTSISGTLAVSGIT